MTKIRRHSLKLGLSLVNQNVRIIKKDISKLELFISIFFNKLYIYIFFFVFDI